MAKNNNQIVRRLKHELTANPAKAAVLGVLLLVAVWFWVPLLAGKSSEAPPPPSGVTASVPDTTVVQSTPAGAPDSSVTRKPLGWKQAIDAIHRDPNMQSVAPVADSRDPFHRDDSRAKEAEALAAAAAQVATPEQAGIHLSSTVVGPRNRTALIGGKTYHAGEMVRGSKSTASFKLVEIHRQHVVLEQGSARYELWLPRAEPVSLDE